MAESIKKKVKYKVEDLEIHSDERGWFLEMHKASKINRAIKQVSVASIKPGKVRGNHYHLNKTEWFMVVGGKAEFYLENPKTKEKVCLKLNPKNQRLSPYFLK